MAKNKVIIVRSFRYDSYDLAVAFNNVAKEMFGQDPFVGTRERLWLPRYPVTFSKVKVGPDQEVKIALGQMEIRGVDGEFVLDGSNIQALINRNETAKVETFLDKISARLKTASIYKGKAITSSRDFIDLGKVKPDLLVYNQKVWEELKDNLWVLLEKTDQCRHAGLCIRRKVLFQGKFGVGKTMAALVTAKLAVNNGFTVFYLEPTLPNVSGTVEFMLQVATKYPPALLVIEDFDREQRAGDFYGLGKLAAAIDGMTSKNSEIVIVFTTNFKDKIAAGLQRPGRIDKIIDFNIFTSQDISQLLKIVIPKDYISADINWEKVSNSVSHMTPAFIGEGIGIGATLAAINRAKKGDKPLVTEEILIQIAEGLQGQHKACEAAEQLGFSSDR